MGNGPGKDGRGSAALTDLSVGGFASVYFEHQVELRRFIIARFGVDQADDLMQELYLKVCQIDDLEGVQKPLAYLYRLALNLSLDERRRTGRAAARDASWRVINHHSVDGEDVVDQAAIEDVLTARRRLKTLADAVDALPDRTRQAFLLHKIDGLTQAQTAGVLGISQRAVEKRLRAALNILMAKVGGG